MRTVWSLNADWKFYYGDIAETNYDAVHKERYSNPHWIKSGNHGVAKWGYDDADWLDVRIPHDFVLERGEYDRQVPASHGSLVKGIGWYRRSFILPEDAVSKRLSIEFDGVFRNSSVWVNGHYVGGQLSGYTSFAYDITEVVQAGEPNVIAVRVDASEYEGWWYEGGGIYRDVRLVLTDSLRIPHWGTFVKAEPEPDGSQAVVLIETEVASSYEKSVTFELQSVLIGPDGERAGEANTSSEINADDMLALKQSVTLHAPYLWSIDSPQLYTLKSTLVIEGEAVDTYETVFGVRTIVFDAERGFLLNGNPLKLKGVCCHEDHAGVGMAVPAAVNAFRIQRLKEMGCNAYRTSHNPPSPSILEACDRLGMLVIDEVRQTEASEDAMNQFKSLIRRDRNHPSVILWSLGNEEMNIQGKASGVRILHAMQKLAHKLDPTRKCTYGMNADWLPITGYHEENGFHIDVHGFNYMMRRNWEAYEQFHEAYPDKPFIGTENASTLSTRGVYKQSSTAPALNLSEHGNATVIWSNPRRSGLVSAYGETYPVWGAQPEEAWKAAAEHDFVAGLFVWTGFDYRGETFPYEWPSVISRYGIMDLCGFPKDIYYYYQARWTDNPVLHLFPHWNWQGSEGETLDVWAFSNMDEIELYLNGKSVGRRDVPAHGHAEWQVAYEAGELMAYGYRNGEHRLTEIITTTGEPACIHLTSDRIRLSADGEDVCIVQAAVVDASGRIVPDANTLITFTLEGPGKLIGTGNGNPECHEQDKQPCRSAYQGLCQVLVRANEANGDIRLIATADGLESGELYIRADSADKAPLAGALKTAMSERTRSERRDAADGGV
ncbi:beta-galactosidase GalA [Paenibacillus sp. NRS-1760]|uniref:beta-galactosidase GalA n=1 Tax=Paenibacillus sp. NRS-1760 TaxID=3233902 RepID=UPI003D27B1D2